MLPEIEKLSKNIPTWFEEFPFHEALKDNIDNEENNDDHNLTNNEAEMKKMGNLVFVPVSLLGRNKWRSSVESNEKVVIRIWIIKVYVYLEKENDC